MDTSFTPAGWLDSFSSIGGGYALIAGRKLSLITQHCDAHALEGVMAQITGQPDRLEAVKHAIELHQCGEGGEPPLLQAADWLQRWADAGGSVQLKADGKAMFGWPEYDLSPAFSGASVRPTNGGDEYLAASRAYSDQMAGMLDELQATPGSVQLVKDTLRALGISGITGRTAQ